MIKSNFFRKLLLNNFKSQGLFYLNNFKFSETKQPTPETINFSHLKSRKVLQIIGKDCEQILQGIITNDMKQFHNNLELTSIYTAFLNAQGRIINDAFIVRPQIYHMGKKYNVEQEYWIDVDASQYDFIKKYIKRYCLRKEIRFNDLSPHINVSQLYAYFLSSEQKLLGCNFQSEIQETEEIAGTMKYGDIPSQQINYANIIFYDPRCPKLGMRSMVSNQQKDLVDSTETKGAQTIRADESVYNQYRTIIGIAEGQELVNKLPFLVNMDFLNAINFNKGCYVGQELTARTYHTGLVRRRLLPFFLQSDKLEEIQSLHINPDPSKIVDENIKLQIAGKTLTDTNGKTKGKILTSLNNIGIAAVPYNTDIENDKISEDLQVFHKEYNGQIMVNDWFQESVKEYLQTLHEKQSAKSKIFSS